MTKPSVNLAVVTATAARGSGGDGHKRGKRVKDEMTYWALRAYMRILKSICAVAESTAHYPQDEDR